MSFNNESQNVLSPQNCIVEGSSPPTPNVGVLSNSVTTPPTSTGTSEGDSFSWLLSDKKRKTNEKFQRLSVCAKSVRSNLGINKKTHQKFYVGVKQTIEWFNQSRGPNELEMDSSRADIWKEVCSLMERSCYNSVYYAKKKNSKSPTQRVGSNGSPTITDENRDPLGAAEDVGVEISGNNEVQKKSLVDPRDEQTQNNAQMPPHTEPESLLFLQKKDFVVILDRKAQLVRGAAMVISPLVRLENGHVDLNKVEVQILSPSNQVYEKGAIVEVPLVDLALIQQSPQEFADSLYTKEGCQRSSSCRLEKGGLVLLDLDADYAEFWPLVARIKEIMADGEMRIEWLWVKKEGPAPDPILNGQFDFCKDSSGNIFEQTVPITAHYFCHFDLDGGYLPAAAKTMCHKMIPPMRD